MVKQNKYLIIQLYDNRRNIESKKRESIYRESILTDNQYKLLKDKIDQLMCKPVSLETGIGIDGDFYELIIRNENKLQAFKWQSIFRTKNSKELIKLKTEVTTLVGELMKYSQFPNGSKQVIVGRNLNTTDSIEIEVFLANQFNIRKSYVYFDDILVNQNKDRVGKITISKIDTIGIRERIKIKAELLNGNVIEM